MKTLLAIISCLFLMLIKTEAQSCYLSWGSYHSKSKNNSLHKDIVLQYVEKNVPIMLHHKQLEIAIDSFRFTYGKVFTPLVSITIANNFLTSEMHEILQTLKSGDVVYLETKNKNACNAQLAFKIK